MKWAHYSAGKLTTTPNGKAASLELQGCIVKLPRIDDYYADR